MLRASATLPKHLGEATKIRRSFAPEGREHLITAGEAERFIALLPHISPDASKRIERAVESLDSPVARAIFLRAALARLSALVAGNERPLEDLETFAGRLHRDAQLDEAELLRRATALDLDSLTNSSARDPVELADRRGVIHERGTRGDEEADNDGLIQRFTASCGPSVIQMMLAQADPIYAFALHDAGVSSSSTSDNAARFQRELLEKYGGIALGQPQATLRARVRNALGRLAANDVIGDREADAFRAFLNRGGGPSKAAQAALAAMRREFRGFPTDAELAIVTNKHLPNRDEGIGGDAFAEALTRLISPATGVYYKQTNPPWGFARGHAYRHIDAVARALRQGADVPFGISEPSHWMLLTAVEGRKPSRRFLVSDPFGGRTDWVTERDFLSGKFARDAFKLSVGRERGYVDCFFLPVAR